MFKGFYHYEPTEKVWKWIVRQGEHEMESGTCKHKEEMKETKERLYFVEWSQSVH